MGLTYGYDIYLRPRNVARALAAVAELAPPARDVPPLDVTLPGGEQIVLPFTSGFGSEPVDCSTSEMLDLDTSLMFGIDDAVRAYGKSSGLPPEENGRVRIGYVYLTVRFKSFLDPGYTALEFWAATSGMSRLFERSASIRKTFTDLATAVGAACCQFDRGDGSPEEVCWLSEDAAFPPAPSTPGGSE
ncbi:hypothetical protein ACFXAE_30170 [Streptomyces sp. NPDC059454]|uniref:hypothetical protein n=1 Tax=Streptomyces sp. NPDC059454 TaxID=3346836 RepID=UPI00368F646D